MNKREIIAYFDARAPEWDARMVRSDSKIAFILDAAGVRPGVSVLDVACGTGVLFGDYLARDAARVTGVDISPEMARIAVSKLRDPRVEVLCGDVEELALLSSGFEIFFEKSPKRIVVRKVNQATSASCKAIASLAIRAFTSSSCVCFAFSAGIALTTKIVPPILSTKPVFISSTVITSLRKNRGVRFRTPRYQPKKDYSFS
ncbi:MAG: class I SAM-dependent methyltransferase [Oscillospiraceae bacterium]|nr:class I SAM-dependent methyltransferase [Oscillospiraceae bacterium]